MRTLLNITKNLLPQESRRSWVDSVKRKAKVKIMHRLNNRDCPFCRIGRHELDHVSVIEQKDVLAIMDLYPATPGHVLVLPKQHITTLYDMPPDLGAHIMAIAITVAKAVKEQLSPDGMNLIQANDIAAGQTVSHFHLHVIPRYKGDPVILQFGHGNIPERVTELERIAFLVKSALGNSEATA
jgi:histidine triad (HIT) family protein